MKEDQRRFIRHPSSVPVRFHKNGHVDDSWYELRNISFGGLSFGSDKRHDPGDILTIEFPSLKNKQRLSGKIVWSDTADDDEQLAYAEGLKFLDEAMFLRARVVEELCHIEAYRRSQIRLHDRELTSGQAAEEWIAAVAHKFPT